MSKSKEKSPEKGSLGPEQRITPPPYVSSQETGQSLDDQRAVHQQAVSNHEFVQDSTVDMPGGSQLFRNPELHRQIEAGLRSRDLMLIVRVDDSVEVTPRSEFLPENGYLVHFNISTAKNPPHIEPLPRAHETIALDRLCMIDGERQYVLEMEAALVGVLENGVMRPQYIGTLADFGDRTPRIEGTGRTYKTWTPDIEQGGSTGISTTWVEVSDWDQVAGVEMEYWVYDGNGDIMLHTPNARADSLKLWGHRLGEWVGAYPPARLEAIGIREGIPFLLSTGQILYEDDGARSINPAVTPTFTANGVMRIDEGRVIETNIIGHTVAWNENTFAPHSAPFSYYEQS